MNENTFETLYNTLITNVDKQNDDINVKYIKNLLEDKTIKYEPQEALLKLFVFYECIKVLKGYKISGMKFNSDNIFYEVENKEFMKSKLRAGSDVSDMTLYKRIEKDKYEIIATTSKNYKNIKNVNGFDISDIKETFNKFLKKEGHTLKVCLVVKDKTKINPKESSTNFIEDLKEIKINNLLLDQNDIVEGYLIFVEKYKNGKLKMNEYVKKSVDKRIHQEWTIEKTIELIKKGEKEIVWGHVARSGKSYMMLFLIKEYIKNNKKCNIMIITTAPKETIKQYLRILEDDNEEELNVYEGNEYNDEKIEGNKNVMITSIQLLKNKKNNEKKNDYIKDNYDIIFIDEAHYGGVTEKSEINVSKFNKNNKCIYIYVTATYTKPVMKMNIKKDNILTWNLVDIGLMKLFNYDKIIERKGKLFKKVLEEKGKYELKEKTEEYKNYPEMEIINLEIEEDYLNYIKENEVVQENQVGWSIEGLFKYSEGVFTNKSALKDITRRIFKQEVGKSIVEVINTEREINKRKKNVIMVYIPLKEGKLVELQKLYKEILKDVVGEDYKIVTISCDEKESIKKMKQEIDSEITKDVIVLSGNMASMGITIPECDIVVLMNNSKSYDDIYQKMFRCMTEGKKKGYIIDINMKRSINMIVQMSKEMTTKGDTKMAITELLESSMINWRKEKIITNNNIKIRNIQENVEEIIKMWRKNTDIDTILDINLRNINVRSSEMAKIMKMMKNGNKIHTFYEDEKLKDIGNGVIKTKRCNYENESENEICDENNEEIQEEVNIEELLKILIPVLGFMSMNNEMSFEKSMKKMKNELILCIDEKFNKGENFINILLDLYNNMDEETKRRIDDALNEIRKVFEKENDYKKLSELVDKYLVPTENEKKKNAEVSTPVKLRREMIGKLKEYAPEVFKNKEIKIFEPCIGKGGFVVDIISELMDGLKDSIKDEKMRYKHIVENCLYMSEINEWNVYIVEKMINPLGEYELNLNKGDTLELDIKKKWKIERFDVVIGNPPYQVPSINQKSSKILWDKFVIKTIDYFLKQDGYLLYIHPSLWRKPNHKLYNIIKNNQIIYLKIYNDIDGKKIFNCVTRADYYILQKCKIKNYTTICFENNEIEKIHLDNIPFIPNYGYTIFRKIQNKYVNGIDTKVSSKLGTSSKNVSKDENETYKYPLFNSNSKKNGLNVRYSKIKHENQNNKKVLFSNGRYIYPIYDDGIYGTTQGGIYIYVKNKTEGENYIKFLNSNLIKFVIKATKWSNFELSKEIFNYIEFPELDIYDNQNINNFYELSFEDINYINKFV